MRPLVCALTTTLLVLTATGTARAEVRDVTPYSQLYTLPAVGEHVIALVRGPGVFVSASVNGLGLDLAQVIAYVRIDGKVVLLSGLGAGAATLAQQVNSGVGVTYSTQLGGSARASFGLAEPLRFDRELKVYVRVEAGAPERVFGHVLVGASEF